MKNVKIITLLSLLCLLLILPTTFAMDNQTIMNVTDDDACGTEYYFDANILNDTGDGTSHNPYKVLTPDRVKDNSIIHLTNGQYTLQKTFTYRNLSIIGENPEKTVISYWNNVGFTSNGLISLKNVTLLNLRVGVSQNSNFTAVNTIFKDSSSNSFIRSTNDGVIINLDNCSFYDSYAQNGGAIYVHGGTLIINNSIFKNNHAKYDGGAIFAEMAEIEVNNSRFIDNYVENDAGGAIFLFDSNCIANNIELINCSSMFGGAIASLSCDLEMTNATARNNKAKYYGGAIYKIYTRFELLNSTFENNCAREGGALYVDSVEDFQIFSNYFANNSASTAGAIFCVVSDFYYDSLFDEELNNSFYKNSAIFEDDVYQSDSVNLDIGDGNYVLLKSDQVYEGNLPSKYDLRKYGYVTSVKNQGSNGNCWAFSSLAALESCILKATGNAYDLSEANMKNLMSLYSDYGWAMQTNKGGYDKMSMGYLTSWLGPVNETDDMYYVGGVLSPILDSFYHIQNILFLTRTSPTDNDLIKKAIIDYGGVSTSICWSKQRDYIKGKNYYYYGDENANHAVCIVGWDDDYSKNNFSHTPLGDGAWIIKNSWGEDSGENGYYYVSYYDVKLAPINKPESIYTFILNDTIKYDRNYQYDIPGYTDFFINTTNTVWYKNRFVSAGNEYLAAVSTYFNKMTNWELQVYVNDALKLTQLGKTQPGYYTIDLDNLIPLNKGDVFEIMFKISVDGDAGIPISESVSLNQRLYSPNTSFVSYDGKTWADFYELEWNYPNHTYYSQVACIKAFTILDKLTPSIDLHMDIYNPIVITATVRDQYGNLVKSGKLTFNVNGEKISMDVVNGVAKITHVFKKLDFYTVSASYVNVGYNNAFASVSSWIYPDNVTIGLDISKNILDAQINVKLSKDIHENVCLKINDENYTVRVTNGFGSLNLKNLYYGNYDILAYVTTDYYYCKNVTGSFTIDYLNTFIKPDNQKIYYNEDYRYSVRLVDMKDNPIANKKIIFTLNNVNFTSKTNNQGIAYLDYQFDCGKYEIEILSPAEGRYLSSTAKGTLSVESTITLPASSYAYNSVYSATLRDSNGDAIPYSEVTVMIESQSRSYRTDANGKLSFNVKLAPNTYSILVMNPETKQKASHNIKVVKRITSNNDLTMYYGAGKSYAVRVYDDNGNIARNVKVTFKVNGKSYTRATDSKGYASLKINLAPKSYTITATYKGCTVKNKITIKPTLIHYDKTVKKSKTFKYTVKLLNSNGKILKYKYVKVTFKGKTYKAKTNSKGIATFNIKAYSKIGKFAITSVYGSAKISKRITVKR